MPSSATSRNRFEKQGAGENANAWGTRLNASVFDLVDEALDGRTAFALSGAKTLSATNFASDEARRRVLDVTGGSGGTITIPAAEKLYLLRNASSGDTVVTTGSGATATIGAGLMAILFCDGSNVRVDGSAASASTSATQAAASAAAAAASAVAAAASESAAETAEVNAESAETASETAAAASGASAAAASASATGAASSASAASASATNAAASATAAAASATAAAAAETNAETAEAAAEAARDAAEGHAASVNPANLMHLTGAETAAGLKTFSNGIAINGQTLAGLTASGKALIEAATFAAIRALLDLEPGTDVQAWHAKLAALAGLAGGADTLPYFTAADTLGQATLSAFARTLLDDADAAAARTTLGIGGGWTQIAQVNTTSGTSADITNIPDTYNDLLLVIEGFSTDSTGGNFRIAVSPDGSSFGNSAQFGASTNPAASDCYGALLIPGYNMDAGTILGAVPIIGSSPAIAATGSVTQNLGWRCTGGINALRIFIIVGNLDAGTATLYGR